MLNKIIEHKHNEIKLLENRIKLIKDEINFIVKNFEYYSTLKLTNSERLVYELICQGYDNNEIAKELFITINTVKKHVSNILIKFGHKTRLELVSMRFNKINNYNLED